MKSTIQTTTKRYRLRTVSIDIIRDANAPDPHRYTRQASDAARLAREFIPDDDREHFGIFILNNRNRLIAYHEVSVGSLNSSIVCPREVFKPVILAGAAAFICVHNHPSGSTSPSPEDIAISRKLKQGADIFGIPLLDHVIIDHGTEAFWSMGDHGQI